MSIDRLKPALVPKEVVNIPAGVQRKEKGIPQPNEVLDTGEEKSTGSSKKQETTTMPQTIYRSSFDGCCAFVPDLLR
ncbi:hypothetical protein NPIL_480411 [Nephila pilipes]|uniref:Uncharacterized protein n=1 Tax=Nephila pilipes TaxID=299642 RepID=A0A8X6UMY5_NEPPI|nr:hypothetical protein NPIL_480411 [Nephila pilipes]